MKVYLCAIMQKTKYIIFFIFIGGLLTGCGQSEHHSSQSQSLILNASGYFETRGLNVMVFSNWYDGSFDDAKISGVEIIHHGVRTVTNGDVRLNPTPGQWDALPEFFE